MFVLDQWIVRELAIETSGRDDRQLAAEGDESFENQRVAAQLIPGVIHVVQGFNNR